MNYFVSYSHLHGFGRAALDLSFVPANEPSISRMEQMIQQMMRYHEQPIVLFYRRMEDGP